MPFCGYDEKMGQAVTLFAQGLIRSLGTKARKENLKFSTQMNYEEVELSLLTNQLRGGDVLPDDRSALLSIVLLVNFLMRPGDGYVDRSQFEEAVALRAQHLDEMMIAFEEAFEASPDLDSSSRVREALTVALGHVAPQREAQPVSR